MRAAVAPHPTGGASPDDSESDGMRPIRVVSLQAMGLPVPIAVTGSSPGRVDGFAEAVVTAWSWCGPTETRSESAIHPIVVDLDRDDDATALARLSSVVSTRAIDEMAHEHLVFHAASCADEASGLAAAFVGPSGRGKTTASIALGREFGYLTDEATAVDARGRVVPYPKPLSVRIPGVPAKEQRSPDAVGVRRATGRDVVLGALFLLDRRHDVAPAGDGGSTTHRTVSVPDAIIALAPELSSLHRLERPLQRLAALIDQVGGVRRLEYTEASSLAPVVRRVLAERAASRVDRRAPRGEWTAVDIEPSPGGGHEPPGAHRRISAIDALVAEGTLVVLLEGSVVAAGGLAPLIWERTRDWTTGPDLSDLLAADLGRPPDADALLSAALDAMHAAGLLERAGS